MMHKGATKTLRNILGLWPNQPIFVAMDGAAFENLPRLLGSKRIMFRALSPGHRSGESGKTGPLMAIVPYERLEAFLSLPNILGSAVFWNTPCGVNEFYRHLRSLTTIRIPSSSGKSRKTKTLVFRHFDPKTLGLVLPIMTPAQRARLFGPAQFLMIGIPEGVLEAKRRTDWPVPDKGPLSFNQEQMDAITGGIQLRLQRKIATFLRKTALDQTKDMDDAALLAFVEEAQKESAALGLTTEAGLGRLAWLQLMSGGRFSQDTAVRQFMRSGQDRPDQRLKTLVEALSALATHKK